jgi:HlyD family secretion protein
MNLYVLSKSINRWVIGSVLLAVAATGTTVYYGVLQFRQAQTRNVVQPIPIRQITALGRLEPEAEIIRVAVPLALDGDRVAQLQVQEGDSVQKGQLLAIMDSRDTLKSALVEAQERVNIAQAKLAQVRAGAKAGEIQAQRATIQQLQAQLDGERAAQDQVIARIEAQWLGDRTAQSALIQKLTAELRNAQIEYQRYRQLSQDGAVADSQLDSKQLALESAQQQLSEAKAVYNRINTTASRQLSEATASRDRIVATGEEQIRAAQATLNQIADVRPVDMQAAQAEVEGAIAAVQRARTDLEQSYVRAPMSGQILELHTRPGEKISNDGLLELAQTDQMVAVAEVYQTDIGQIKLGQPAVVTGQAFKGEVQGTVSFIDRQVSRQSVFGNQPGENLDKRVVETKIRLTPKDSRKVASLTNLQVQVTIKL